MDGFSEDTAPIALAHLESYIENQDEKILVKFNDIYSNNGPGMTGIETKWEILFDFWQQLKNSLIVDESDDLEDVAVGTEKINHGVKRKRRAESPSVGLSWKKSKNKSLTQMEDSRERAAGIFEWMTSPVTTEKFMSDYWEKDFLHLKRNSEKYYKKVFSTAKLDSIFKRNHLLFSKNIDVTTYVDGVRDTHNPEGRAYPSVIWDMYSTGASVRFLNPQTYCNSVWKLCEGLQDAFNCFVGANVYLTPPGTQGFAPHYDDIEAFVLQLEGKKRWRVYSPRSHDEELPLVSSPNLDEKDLGEPDLDVILESGDLLYFPRGFIHQANALPDTHSLHITVSCYQKNSWAEFLGRAVPASLALTTEENVELRRGLPRNYLNYMGLVHSDTEDPELAASRTLFRGRARYLLDLMADNMPLDSAADQMGKKLLHDALPPALTEDEKVRTVFGGGEFWENGEVVNHVEMSPDTEIRLLRANVARLIMEGEEIRLYFSSENSREYHELFPEEPPYLVIESHLAPAIEYLISSFPKYKKVSKLPLEELSDKVCNAFLPLFHGKLYYDNYFCGGCYDLISSSREADTKPYQPTQKYDFKRTFDGVAYKERKKLERNNLKIELATALWDKGIIISKDALVSGFDG